MTSTFGYDELLTLAVPLRLATNAPSGYPRLTPLWFVYDSGAFHMTSLKGKAHLRDLERDPRCALLIDTASHRRVRAHGRAELSPDQGGAWTRRITLKYVSGTDGQATAARRAAQERVLITLRPG